MLNNAIEQTMEMVIITNEEGIVEYINPAVEKITGYSKEEFIGFNPRLLKSDKHDNRFYKNMWDMIKAGDIWKGQLVNKKKSGELYDEEMTISPVQNAHGKITNFIAIKRDISETKNLQQQLIQAEKLSSMGTFVSGVAHELNNPLSSILGFAQSLATKNNLPTEMMNMIKIIEQESKRAAVIVHDLLRFSKKQTSGKTPLIINDVLARVLNLQTYHFHKESLEVKTDYSKAPLTIKGDINQLQQVFINIIVNAHYEMTKAKVKGVLSIKSEKKEKDVLISIENNGPPIAKNHLSKIFDPFFSTKRIGKGTGLGLSISYGIIKDHGGKIWAENVGDSGVRFLIALPLVFDEAKKLIPQSKNSLLPKDIQILLAYEDEDVHRSIMSVFSKEGLSAQSAKNGKKAENLLELNNFDVILSDVQLPRMKGLKLGKWLKRNKPEDLQKLVILTGIIDKKISDYCEKFNCEYLIKPVKKEGLIEIIRKIIQKNA
jgi:PAS domain S-box-containing protein